MKLLLVGDLHLRVKTPEGRTDADFMQTCLGKLRQILEIAEDRGCEAIIQAGDFFHNPNPSKELIAEVINLLNEKDKIILTIHGQHDMSFHSKESKKKSALAVLEAAGVVTCLNDIPCVIEEYEKGKKDVAILGASFGETPTTIENKNVSLSGDGTFFISVSHVMVGDKPLWPGHDLTSAEEYVKKYPNYDLYLVGDYHYPFAQKVENTDVINAGCVLRLTRGKRDLELKPKVVLYDTENTGGAEDIYLDVQPVEDVFDLSERTEKENNSEELCKLVEQLKESGQVGVSFAENLQAYYKQNDTLEGIRDIIAEAMPVEIE